MIFSHAIIIIHFENTAPEVTLQTVDTNAHEERGIDKLKVDS